MSRHESPRSPLEIDPDSVEALANFLVEIGFDETQQVLRPDYFTSPFPSIEELSRWLPQLAPRLALAIRLFVFGEPVATDELQRTIGRELLEAGLVCGLLVFDDETDEFSTAGYSLVSRLGQHFVVSANPYYLSFDPANAGVYMGVDSFTLVNGLQRRLASLPTSGQALDLCTGSGIAGQSVAALLPGLEWTGIDLDETSIVTANFNARLNHLKQRFHAVKSDLYTAIGGKRFDLITANPPFIPVPDGLGFPVYGAGGEDGLLVLRPMLAGLPRHLAPAGRAVIYAEGIGSDGRLIVEDDLAALAVEDFDCHLTIISSVPIDNALYTLGLMLSRQRPSRLAEVVRWQDLFARQGVDHYAKFILDVSAGSGQISINRLHPILPGS